MTNGASLCLVTLGFKLGAVPKNTPKYLQILRTKTVFNTSNLKTSMLATHHRAFSVVYPQNCGENVICLEQNTETLELTNFVFLKERA